VRRDLLHKRCGCQSGATVTPHAFMRVGCSPRATRGLAPRARRRMCTPAETFLFVRNNNSIRFGLKRSATCLQSVCSTSPIRLQYVPTTSAVTLQCNRSHIQKLRFGWAPTRQNCECINVWRGVWAICAWRAQNATSPQLQWTYKLGKWSQTLGQRSECIQAFAY
jgi:hypothetical protein